MSLRMNLYGWHLFTFKQALGSQNKSLLNSARAHLSKTFKEPQLSRANAFVRTLVENGYPLLSERQFPSEPDDGGLLTMQMETETHVFAVHCLARALATPEHLDLAMESSTWSHPSIGALLREVGSCGFTRSKEFNRKFYTWIWALDKGTPLFGDEFHTTWSRYTLFPNQELTEIVQLLRAAATFARKLPESYTPEQAKQFPTSLSPVAQKFANDLAKWFDQIQQAGQDAFILWS